MEVLEIKDHDQICIFISLEKLQNWDTKTSLPKSKQVSEVTVHGSMDLFGLSSIITEFSYASKLTIMETDRGNCDFKQLPEHRKSKVYLENLTELKFYNAKFCQHLYKFFSKTFLLTELTTLEVGNTSLNRKNIDGIHELLNYAKFSLKTMKFNNVKGINQLLQHFSHALPSLAELQFNFGNSSDLDQHLMAKLRKYAPNLKILMSKNGYLETHQLPDLFDLNKIETLDIGINVPMNHELIDISAIFTHMPALRHLELSLSFKNPYKCTVIKNASIKTSVTFNLHSNCKLTIKTL